MSAPLSVDFLSPFIRGLAELKLDFVSGVPCSSLSPLIGALTAMEGARHVPATSEGEAVAMAAGAWAAGGRPAVLFQNSGLGNAVNPLTSLAAAYRIPLLLIIGWRGMPGRADEPQHALMGEITPHLLDLLQIPHHVVGDDTAALATVTAGRRLDEGSSFAFLIPPAQGNGGPPAPPPRACRRAPVERLGATGSLPTRIDALQTISDRLPRETLLLSTTGKTSRELHHIGDRATNLYLVGSMGYASAVALGLSIGLRGERPVAILDGDGASLMHLGNLTTIGAESPRRFLHIVLDNGVHDSTGGQPTNSATADLAGIAAASGYERILQCGSLAGLASALSDALDSSGPTFLHMKIRPGSIPSLGRPDMTLPALIRRFRAEATSISNPKQGET